MVCARIEVAANVDSVDVHATNLFFLFYFDITQGRMQIYLFYLMRSALQRSLELVTMRVMQTMRYIVVKLFN